MPEENAAASSAPQKKTVSKARAAHIAQLKRKRRALLLVVLSLFLTFYIALSLIVGLWVYISFNHVPSRTLYGVRTVKYVGTKNTEKVITSAGSDVSNRGYGLYISAADLDQLCDLSFAGDDKKLTVILPGGKEFFECFADSSSVIINGTGVRLAYPVLYSGGTYYFPVMLVEEYITGIKIVYGEKDKWCRISLENGDDTALGLRFKQTVAPERIPVPDL